MLIILNDDLTSSLSAFCSISDDIDTSDVTKTSMVAILGCIIPEPLAIPPILHSVPSISKERATSFSIVSVVIIAAAASWLLFPSALTKSSILDAMGFISNGWPITPVEATTTSSLLMPVYFSVRAHISCAISIPLALQVFAFPLLHIIAIAFPSFILSLVTAIGAPFTRFWV